ncbi:type II secretion system F family protein [Poseidonibacter lekithochrous]|uniref:type II secretion system F family protein n=1 Tax=Poseidonibacter TaxID=2321187 RepID=UPI001C0860DF|nr:MULTISPECIES: type II secretion system F family protein [Poseidonibacter]MBU3015680.1 type II secretion system F family protein [Poseidonibacter lekithochrous]MDO6828981.1 type II secretion system F family protein [Poseidonibacter sp. 1_MG-2023]
MKKYKVEYQSDSGIKNVLFETNDISKEKLPSNIINIKEIKKLNSGSFFQTKKTIKEKVLINIFYELNLMLESNITLSDALDILIKNRKDKVVLEFLQTLKYSFSSSKKVSQELSKFKINYLVGSFLDISQSSGNIVANIKALSELLIEAHEIKKSFIKSITYPIILMISFFLSLISIFYFVIPKFKTIFEQTNAELPLATQMLLNVQYLFENYLIILLIIVIFLISLFIFFYKKDENFEYFIHKIAIKNIYLIKDIYLNMQLYKLFLFLDIMLKSKYEFHKSLISSKVLIKNKYLLDKMSIIDNLLQNGKGISFSFSKTEIFDDITLNLINTGEVSNSLDITVCEIKKIYKNRFNDKINLLTALIEPFFLVSIMSLILWIVLAVFMPIWDMGNIIKV